MGHYDSSRPGYCAGCGAAPGNMRDDGSCPFCEVRGEDEDHTSEDGGPTEADPLEKSVGDEAGGSDKFGDLQMLEVFRLKNGLKAVKVGKTSYIRMTDQGHACKLRIKNTKAVTRLGPEETASFKKALT